MLLIQCAALIGMWMCYTLVVTPSVKSVARFVVLRQDAPEWAKFPAVLFVCAAVIVFCMAFVAGIFAHVTLTVWLKVLV